jgi:hypothetical protein
MYDPFGELCEDIMATLTAKLRASLDAKQHCTDPNVQAAIARARAVLGD